MLLVETNNYSMYVSSTPAAYKELVKGIDSSYYLCSRYNKVELFKKTLQNIINSQIKRKKCLEMIRNSVVTYLPDVYKKS